MSPLPWGRSYRHRTCSSVSILSPPSSEYYYLQSWTTPTSPAIVIQTTRLHASPASSTPRRRPIHPSIAISGLPALPRTYSSQPRNIYSTRGTIPNTSFHTLPAITTLRCIPLVHLYIRTSSIIITPMLKILPSKLLRTIQQPLLRLPLLPLALPPILPALPYLHHTIPRPRRLPHPQLPRPRRLLPHPQILRPRRLPLPHILPSKIIPLQLTLPHHPQQ